MRAAPSSDDGAADAHRSAPCAAWASTCRWTRCCRCSSSATRGTARHDPPLPGRPRGPRRLGRPHPGRPHQQAGRPEPRDPGGPRRGRALRPHLGRRRRARAQAGPGGPPPAARGAPTARPRRARHGRRLGRGRAARRGAPACARRGRELRASIPRGLARRAARPHGRRLRELAGAWPSRLDRVELCYPCRLRSDGATSSSGARSASSSRASSPPGCPPRRSTPWPSCRPHLDEQGRHPGPRRPRPPRQPSGAALEAWITRRREPPGPDRGGRRSRRSRRDPAPLPLPRRHPRSSP